MFFMVFMVKNRHDRLWRLRRQHDRIDAVLMPVRLGWHLQLYRNGSQLFSRRFADPEAARAEAKSRWRDLLRAGWVAHW